MSKITGYGLGRRNDEGHVVAVAATGRHTWRLQACHAVDVGDALSDDLLRDLGRAGRNTAWLLPEDDVTCTQTPMPRLKPREMARAVQGWVARQEGGAPDDWAVSWRAFASVSGNSETHQVAMVYGHAEDIEGQVAAAVRMGVEPGLMLPPSLVLDQFFRAAAPESASLNVWNLVFLGARANLLCVANQDGVLLTRPLPGNLASGDQAEYIARLATEVDRSVFFARQTAGSPQVDGVFVCGDPELAEALQEKLRESSGVPCQHWRLQQAVDCGDHDVDPDTQLLIMAAALVGQSTQYNLAPRARQGLIGDVLRRRLLIGAGTAAVAVVPLLIAGAALTSSVQDGYLERARSDLDQATLRAEHAATIYERQRLLRAREDYLMQHQATRHDLEHVLRELAGAAPDEVRFRELQLIRRDDGMVLQLTGTSSASEIRLAQQAFMRFQDAVAELEVVQPLGEPRQLQIGEADGDGQIEQIVVFTMECRLERAASGQEG